jgi:hypothetical protein
MAKTVGRTAEKSGSPPLIVLGYDEQQKPCGALFQDANSKLVADAAKAMGFNAYNVPSGDIMDLAKKLPTGRLYATGKGFVPNIKPSLYSQLIVTLAGEPQATPLGKDEPPPVAIGLPKNWDEIAPGHLVIAQESLDYGWWEAVVLERTGDMLRLRFRDHPKLPKFTRHRASVALISTTV